MEGKELRNLAEGEGRAHQQEAHMRELRLKAKALRSAFAAAEKEGNEPEKDRILKELSALEQNI